MDGNAMAHYINESAGGYYGLSVFDWLLGGIGGVAAIVGLAYLRDVRMGGIGVGMVVAAAILNYYGI